METVAINTVQSINWTCLVRIMLNLDGVDQHIQSFHKVKLGIYVASESISIKSNLITPFMLKCLCSGHQQVSIF